MTKKHYPAEFKQEAASLVLDQGYTRKATRSLLQYEMSLKWLSYSNVKRP